MVAFNWILYTYAGVLTVCACIMHTAISPPLLILCCLLFILSLVMKPIGSSMPWIRLLLIICFHGVSQLNWSLPLYLLIMSKDMKADDSRTRAWLLSIVHGLAYLTVAYFVWLNQGTSVPWLYMIVSAVHFAAAGILSRTSRFNFNQNELFKKERVLLSKQDSLTGLYNYEESHRRLERLIEKKQSLALILIDCTDLKSMNTTRGFQAGNLILKQIAELLKILFSDALFIARYGGDEFAVVIPLKDHNPDSASYKLQLDSELPKLTGIQITYGIATYPAEVQTKDDLILLAEHNLFTKKREAWLKREEHMLRSEKLRVVGELASGMAHEIRNPLTTVRGFLQISRANGYNIENWYAMIMDEIDRMSELTAEFLQFSKPHATQFRVHSLHECVLKVISLTESEATRLGHEIHYSESFQPIYMMMDQDKMIQLLLNLVKNAFEAMEESGIVQIKLSRDQKHASLIIEDNGPGIPGDLLEKIFHPFYTTKETGTGLGLSICHKIVQDHYGTLEVESQPGQGARFIITFPIMDEESHSEMEKAAFS